MCKILIYDFVHDKRERKQRSSIDFSMNLLIKLGYSVNGGPDKELHRRNLNFKFPHPLTNHPKSVNQYNQMNARLLK